MNTSIYAAVMPENSRCMRFMAWGYITIPITVKRLYGLVFAYYGEDTESTKLEEAQAISEAVLDAEGCTDFSNIGKVRWQ